MYPANKLGGDRGDRCHARGDPNHLSIESWLETSILRAGPLPSLPPQSTLLLPLLGWARPGDRCVGSGLCPGGCGGYTACLITCIVDVFYVGLADDVKSSSRNLHCSGKAFEPLTMSECFVDGNTHTRVCIGAAYLLYLKVR